MGKEASNKKDIDFALQAVPSDQRKNFGSMFVIMMGFTFFQHECGWTAWRGIEFIKFYMGHDSR